MRSPVRASAAIRVCATTRRVCAEDMSERDYGHHYGPAPSVGDGYRRCPSADEAGIVVQGSVRTSAEWTARISRQRAGRGPVGWCWAHALRRRAAALTREPWLSLEYDDGSGNCAEVAYARNREEAQWARAFVARAADGDWCLSLARFDRRALQGSVIPCGDGLVGRDNRIPEVDRRDERAARHSTGRLANSFAVE